MNNIGTDDANSDMDVISTNCYWVELEDTLSADMILSLVVSIGQLPGMFNHDRRRKVVTFILTAEKAMPQIRNTLTTRYLPLRLEVPVE